METRPTLKNTTDEKGWLERGQDLVYRFIGTEEDVVKKFLEKSNSYDKLQNIIKTSKESRAKGGGVFGGNSIFQRTLYQISPDEEQMIENLSQAKSFYELLNKIPLKREVTESPYAGPFLNQTGKVVQEAHFFKTLLDFLKEIKDFANRNFYSLEPPAREYQSTYTSSM